MQNPSMTSRSQNSLAGLGSPHLKRGNHQSKVDLVLKHAMASWFVIALIGQLVFILYISSFYGRAALAGDLSQWNRVLPVGYIPGDTMHNLALSIHLALAVLITISGALQLAPQIRNNYRSFHRINGKFYFLMAVVTSCAGTYMIWTRDKPGDLSQDLGVTFNAILIVLCTLMAYRNAAKRNFRAHQEWALRLFLTVSGTWFFRIGLFFWLTIHQGPVGFDPKSFSGPFLSILSFAQSLLPLIIVELCFAAKRSKQKLMTFCASIAVIISCVVIGIGITSASLGLWLPRIGN